jgi:hypothetical protein
MRGGAGRARWLRSSMTTRRGEPIRREGAGVTRTTVVDEPVRLTFA